MLGKAAESADIGSQKASGVVQNIAGAGPSGLPEVPRKSWRAFEPVLEPSWILSTRFPELLETTGRGQEALERQR